MSADTVCRVCLIDNTNLYSVRNDLRNVYDSLTGEKHHNVFYSIRMCYICLAVLRKCHKFMETARDSNEVLKQWHNQQNEMRVARPLYTYSIRKAEFVSMYNENISSLADIKVEIVESQEENVPPEFNIDVVIEKTDIDEQTYRSELLEDNDNVRSDAVEGNNDRQTDRTSSLASNLDDHINIETRIQHAIISPHGSDAPPLKKRKIIKTKLQHKAPETSGETAANRETSNDITPLNITPTQPDIIRQRITKKKPTFAKNSSSSKETAKYKPLSCNICDYKCKKEQDLVRHTRTHTDAPPLKKRKINETELQHKAPETSGETAANRETSNDLTPSNRTSTQTDIIRQIITMKKPTFGKNSSCSKETAKYKPWSCNICDYKCIKEQDLVRHTRTHTDARPLKKRKMNETALQHKAPEPSGETAANRETSNDITPFNRTPTQPDIIRQRITKEKSTFGKNSSSSKETAKYKPLSCNICDYKCIKEQDLVRHMRTHTASPLKKHKINETALQHKAPETSGETAANRETSNDITPSNRTPTQTDIIRQIITKKKPTFGKNSSSSKETAKYKPLSCNICDFKCKKKQDLVRHMRKHTGEKPFQCSICKFRFTLKGSLVIHMRIHTGEKPFSCEICDLKFTNKRILVSHMTTHTGKKPFSCEICDHKYTQKGHLVVHMRTHTSEKLLSCDICGHKCTEKSNLAKHILTHTDEKSFSCKICEHKFAQKRYLVKHMITHTGEKPFSCEICDQKFTQKNTLKTHVRTHTGEKPFSCEICSYNFAQKRFLKIHMKGHTGERPFACDICDQKYTQKSHLVRHLITHASDKPFSCEICDKKYTDKSNLIIHMRTHTGEKPYSCEICLNKFAQRQALNTHMKGHTGEKPFSCNICDYKCTEKSYLSRHLKTHDDSKPFYCNICHYKFKRKDALTQHLKAHNNEKPISCDICDYKCIRNSYLKRHLLTKHLNTKRKGNKSK